PFGAQASGCPRGKLKLELRTEQSVRDSGGFPAAVIYYYPQARTQPVQGLGANLRDSRLFHSEDLSYLFDGHVVVVVQSDYEPFSPRQSIDGVLHELINFRFVALEEWIHLRGGRG